ncbi:hypothetical protein U1Q18_022419 [Sarracenia purpurea var. burkii]
MPMRPCPIKHSKVLVKRTVLNLLGISERSGLSDIIADVVNLTHQDLNGVVAGFGVLEDVLKPPPPAALDSAYCCRCCPRRPYLLDRSSRRHNPNWGQGF